MKTTIIFFALMCVLLTGCSTDYNYASKKITVHKINGINKDYGLLSVRGDSAIVVLDWEESEVTPIPYSHAVVIKKDSIFTIVRDGHGPGKTVTYGALVGAIAESVILIPAILANHSSSTSSLTSMVGGFSNGALYGALAGSVIGTVSPPSMDILLSSAADREFLRSISLYPMKEPDEMQYIK